MFFFWIWKENAMMRTKGSNIHIKRCHTNCLSRIMIGFFFVEALTFKMQLFRRFNHKTGTRETRGERCYLSDIHENPNRSENKINTIFSLLFWQWNVFCAATNNIETRKHTNMNRGRRHRYQKQLRSSVLERLNKKIQNVCWFLLRQNTLNVMIFTSTSAIFFPQHLTNGIFTHVVH